MKFKVACHKPSDDSFFNDEITIQSVFFSSPEACAAAVRRLYETASPSIEVLGIVSLVEVERGFH